MPTLSANFVIMLESDLEIAYSRTKVIAKEEFCLFNFPITENTE